MLYKIRWWLFRRLSWIAWGVCPEPDRTRLRKIFDVRWADVKKDFPHKT